MAENYEDVLGQITVIATETVAEANTARRVGGAMSAMTALSAAMTGAINAGALTGVQQWANMQAMLTALSGVALPVTTFTAGVMIGWRDVLMQAHLSRYVSGDPYQAGSWEELPVERYARCVEWSGVTVAGVAVQQSGSSGSDAASVVLDTVRPSFLYLSGGKYYAEWSSRSQYQAAVVSGSAGDPQFNPGLFKGLDGSLWSSSGSSSVVKVVDAPSGGGGDEAYMPLAEWSGVTVTGAQVVADTSIDGSDPASVVLDTGKMTFLYRSGGNYYTWWTTAGQYQSNAWSSAVAEYDAGFAHALFKGLDGSLWWPVSSSELRRLDAGQGYVEVREWSGETVAGVAVEPVGSTGSDPASVVLDTVRPSFLYRSGGKYYAEWSSRSQYQAAVVTGPSGDPQFNPGLFRGLDGSLWAAAGSGSMVMAVPGAQAGGAVEIAGVFAGPDDDITERPVTGGQLYFLKARGCFGVGVVSAATGEWTGRGYKRFMFAGKTEGFTAEDAGGGMELFAAGGNLLLPKEGQEYAATGRGMSWRGSKTSEATGALSALSESEEGDFLLDDGTLAKRESVLWDGVPPGRSLAGIVVDPARRVMLPLPAPVITQAYANSRAVAVVGRFADLLGSQTGCEAYAAILEGMKPMLGGTASSLDSYFPAFYASLYGDKAKGMRLWLATREECTKMGNDWRIQSAAEIANDEAAGSVPAAFYGVTPRYAAGEITSLGQVVLEGDAAKGNATLTGSQGGFTALALYND